MKEFYTESELRQIEIIEMLDSRYLWLNRSHIESHLGITYKTLINDIDTINFNLPSIHIHKRNGDFRIEYLNDIMMQRAFQELQTNNLKFKFLSHIFFHPTNSLEDIAILFFLSTSTLYRLVDEMNLYFSDHHMDFQILTTPCRIEGNEAQIRYFYRLLFENSPETLFHQAIASNFDTNKILNELTQLKNDENLFIQDILTLRMVFLINQTRNHHNFLLEDFPNRSSHLEKLTKSGIDKNARLAVYGFSPSKLADYFSQSFYPFYDDNYPYWLDFRDLEATRQVDCEEIDYLSNMLDEIANVHQINLSNKEELIARLHNVSVTFQRMHFYVKPFHDPLFIYKRDLAFYPHFWQKLEECLKDYSCFTLGIENKEFILHCTEVIITQWHLLPFQLQNIEEPIKVGIYNSHHHFFGRTLASILKNDFYTQMQIDLLTDKDLRDIDQLKNSYDIIISNTSFEGLADNQLVLSDNTIDQEFILFLRRKIRILRLTRIKDRIPFIYSIEE